MIEHVHIHVLLIRTEQSIHMVKVPTCKLLKAVTILDQDPRTKKVDEIFRHVILHYRMQVLHSELIQLCSSSVSSLAFTYQDYHTILLFWLEAPNNSMV